MSPACLPKAKGSESEVDVEALIKSLNTNLRLLDLDLRPRAVKITPLTFSTRDKAQNQGQRIRTAEWVIYRLFETWDRKETQKVSQALCLETLSDTMLILQGSGFPLFTQKSSNASLSGSRLSYA